MDGVPSGEQSLLTWSNVALAFSFVAFDAVLSSVYRLGISSSLITAAVRCVIQLSIMALVLESIFKAKSPYGVAGLARESHPRH
jgi:ABC-type iron transport system FetAB permease component